MTISAGQLASLQPLAALPLARLSLVAESGCGPVDIDLTPLASMTGLREFSSTGVRLLNLNALRNASVGDSRVSDAISVAELSAITPGWQLEKLRPGTFDDLASLRSLNFATNLRELLVERCGKVFDLDGAHVWNDSLERLTLCGCSIVHSAALSGLTRLMIVDVGSAVFSDYAALSQLSELRELILGVPDDPGALREVRALAELRHLTVKGRGLLDLSVLEGIRSLQVAIASGITVFGHDRLGAGSRVVVRDTPDELGRPVSRRAGSAGR